MPEEKCSSALWLGRLWGTTLGTVKPAQHRGFPERPRRPRELFSGSSGVGSVKLQIWLALAVDIPEQRANLGLAISPRRTISSGSVIVVWPTAKPLDAIQEYYSFAVATISTTFL